MDAERAPDDCGQSPTGWEEQHGRLSVHMGHSALETVQAPVGGSPGPCSLTDRATSPTRQHHGPVELQGMSSSGLDSSSTLTSL